MLHFLSQPDRRGELESERWGGGGNQEGRTPPASSPGGGECGGAPFPVLPTPDRYARASLSKHVLAHSRFTLLSLP